MCYRDFSESAKEKNKRVASVAKPEVTARPKQEEPVLAKQSTREKPWYVSLWSAIAMSLGAARPRH
jgi:hypothetical protein